METVAIAAIGNLSIVKGKLTERKKPQRGDFQVTVTDDKRKTLLYNWNTGIYLSALRTSQSGDQNVA